MLTVEAESRDLAVAAETILTANGAKEIRIGRLDQ